MDYPLTMWLALLPLAALAQTPGTELLRAGQQEALVKALGLASVDELPTYALDLSLSDSEGRYSGRSTLTWTNRTGKPVAQPLHPGDDRDLTGQFGRGGGSPPPAVYPRRQ